jgi:diguanylate cyclase (GGDEF)-like protein
LDPVPPSGADSDNGDAGPDDPLVRLLHDQTLSDRDQTHADRDQTGSDRDQTLSERDQASSDRDQQASDLEQAHADQAPHTSAADSADYASSTADRVEASASRLATTAERARTAARRLDAAQIRDVTAQERDEAAAERDRIAASRETAGAPPGAGESAQGLLIEVRRQAAEDRARAAADRASAAADREESARDRTQAAVALRHAYHDDLTGALRRDMGELALQHEIDRAERGDGRLVLAFVDVDRLKEVNDRSGHGAGDALLQAVVSAMRAKLRSFDPIVRYGGDEFICALTATDPDEATERFGRIQEMLAHEHEDGAISVGVAALEPGDTLDGLVARGDKALYEAKRRRPR